MLKEMTTFMRLHSFQTIFLSLPPQFHSFGMMMQFLCNINFCFSWALCHAMVVGHNSSKMVCLANSLTTLVLPREFVNL
jgi:hypothetical protein